MAERWTRESWRKKPIIQVPEYPDKAALDEVENNLRNFPPLVFVKEVRDLKQIALQPGEWYDTHAVRLITGVCGNSPAVI